MGRDGTGDAGGAGQAPHDAPNDVTGEGPAVGTGDQQGIVGVAGPPCVEKLHQHRMQRQVAVIAKLADRHAQPLGGTDEDYGVGLQGAQLVDPQSSAGQGLDHQAVEGIRHHRSSH